MTSLDIAFEHDFGDVELLLQSTVDAASAVDDGPDGLIWVGVEDIPRGWRGRKIPIHETV